MRYLALATDYDGTLAHHGRVRPETVAALHDVIASGRKIILVTGRELNELLEIFPEIELCELVVAENGGLLYRPATKEFRVLGDAPPEVFVQALQRRGVAPLSVGASIVATVHPNETIVLEAIRDLGLELQVIFNKGAVMVLPANVNKASGLAIALEEMKFSPHNVVGIGDAENDHALLNYCEYSAAVANAVPMLKAEADRTTVGDHGDGVIELIRDLIDNDLSTASAKEARRSLLIGHREDGEVRIPPAGGNILIAGSSGSGKSTLATGLLERLAKQDYQLCIIDPEGDYEDFENAIVFGSNERAPSASEVLTALEKPDTNVVVNLIGLPLADRPEFFLSLLPRLQELRSKTGRPHWILVDEAHHLLPTDWQPAAVMLGESLKSMMYVTVHPEWIAPGVLQGIDIVATLGEEPDKALANFAKAANIHSPSSAHTGELEPGHALLWFKHSREQAFTLRIEPPQGERRRHRRKYAEGELPEDRSFYFRGPEEKLNLRAQNLMLFTQLADGVDDETWLHHLRRGDYSEWMRRCVKDDVLADEVHQVEEDAEPDPRESRKRVREAVEHHYTLPAGKGTSDSVAPTRHT